MGASSPPDPTPACLRESDPEQAWATFLQDHVDTVYRSVGRACSDDETARDVAAEVLTRLHDGWPDTVRRYEQQGRGKRCRFDTWLAVVVRNLAIDVLRSWHGRRMLPRSVSRRPRWHQSLYRLVYWEGRSVAEAYEVLVTGEEFEGSLAEVADTIHDLHATLPASSRLPLPRVVSLEVPAAAGDEEGTTMELPDTTAPDAESGQVADDARTRLSGIMSRLDPNERLLLRMYFLEGVGAAELVQVVGVRSRSQVYTKVHGLLDRLRKALRDEGLDIGDLEHLLDFDWLGTLDARSGGHDA